MKFAFFAAAILAALGPWPVYAQKGSAVALEAAITKEQVDGDLPAAMASYQKIAADTTAPRDVRAKALLRLAGCYEKLGKVSQAVYQQIVRDFGDLPSADQARARLAAFRQGQPSASSSITQRKIEIPGGSFGPQASDGRRMVYRNDATGELIYSDPSTKTWRVIYKGSPGDLPEWMPSRDFSMVALQFKKKPDRPAYISLIQIDGKGRRELIRDDEKGTVFGVSGELLNWSWDNRYLLVNHREVTGAQWVLVVSTSTGEHSPLMSRDDGSFSHCAFSPDGRFVACKESPGLGVSGSSRILVVPSQGGEPHTVWEEADPYMKMLDWTDDGRHLAISSARTGTSALYLLPVKDGRTTGEPILVQSGIFESGFTTKAGALIYQKPKPGGLWTIHTAVLDADGRAANWQKLERPGENPTNPWPHWSPDSSQLVYTARDMEGEFGNSAVRVRNVATGKDREIFRTAGHIVCVWGAQRPQIFCSQWKESTSILSLAPDTGQFERIGSFATPAVLMYQPGSDDRSLHFWRIVKGKVLSTLWEIATGQETVLATDNLDSPVTISSDGRLFVRANRHQLDVKSPEGDWKTVTSTPNTQTAITRDGSWVYYHGTDASGNHALYRVSAAGSAPERLGSFPTHSDFGTMDISPDGRHIVTTSFDYENGFELWALENMIPAAAKR